MYDLLIRNARIIDGTGAPWYYGDLAVKDGIIAAMGKLGTCNARETVDAAGLALSPGFIDIHCHSDETLLNDARGEGRLLQGVTLEIGGNCGMSMAPAQPETLDLPLMTGTPSASSLTGSKPPSLRSTSVVWWVTAPCASPSWAFLQKRPPTSSAPPCASWRNRLWRRALSVSPPA